MRSDGNFPKNEESTVEFSFTIMLQHRSVLVEDFFANNNVRTPELPPA
jgi:hypothetical protein